MYFTVKKTRDRGKYRDKSPQGDLGVTSDLSAPRQWAWTHHTHGPWPFLVCGFLELEGPSGPWSGFIHFRPLGLYCSSGFPWAVTTSRKSENTPAVFPESAVETIRWQLLPTMDTWWGRSPAGTAEPTPTLWMWLCQSGGVEGVSDFTKGPDRLWVPTPRLGHRLVLRQPVSAEAQPGHSRSFLCWP